MNGNGTHGMMVNGNGGQPGQMMGGTVPQGNYAQPVMQQQMQPMIGPNGQPLMGMNGVPVMQPSPVVQVEKGGSGGLLKTILVIILSLTTATFAGLFIWKQVEFSAVSTDVDLQISDAVEKAKYEQKEEDLVQFAEDEKYPLRSFVGPVDYGQLSFEYPKTWSLYIDKDASDGGDYEAYFNPLAVEAISNKTVNALRVAIYDESFDEVTASFQGSLNSKDSGLSMSTVDVNGVIMNRYVGNIPGTEFSGAFVVFKIRDKTAVIRTDAEQFMGDFDALLQTISFNA